MKTPKPIVTRIDYGIILIFILSFNFSCVKNEIIFIEESNPIVSAHLSFESKRNQIKENRGGKDLFFDVNLEKINWDEAILKENRNDKMHLFVPIELRGNYLTQEDEKGNRHFLFMQLKATSQNKGKDWHFELVTYIPEGEGRGPLGEFVGTIVSEDWFGYSPARYAQFYDGKLVKNHPELQRNMVFGQETVCFLVTVEYYSNDRLTDSYSFISCDPIDNSDPEDWQVPQPDEPEGGGGGSSGNVLYIRKFINNITEPCLKSTVDKAINSASSMMGLVAEIISRFDDETSVEITINEEERSDAYPGRADDFYMLRHSVTGKMIKFAGTIYLNKNYMPEVSQEGVIAVLIHEIMHAYIRETELFERLPIGDNSQHHQIFADNYITPMAEFLIQLFGISSLDAHALAWSGLADLNSPLSVLIDGTTYSRNDLFYISAAYMGRGADGQHLAGTDKCIELNF